jgi:muramoyltetrapeptide carboxypeptidase
VKTPPALKKGDTVIIAATARKTTQQAMDPAIKILHGWGLKVLLAPNLFKEKDQFAGSDDERADGLQWALDQKDAKAIILACGGYGTIRIIDEIKFKKFRKDPKWIAGYSDATVLQTHLLSLGIASIHSTMAFQFAKDKAATESLRKALFGERLSYKAKAHILNRHGKAKAEVIGGNLSLLYALSGSKSHISTKGKILFIEDLDEYLYHIDRMMMQLKRSGQLKNLKGLVVGGMSDMKDNAIPFGKTAEQIIFDAVKDYKYPVCFDFPAGHIKKNNALYIGKKAQLKVDKNGTQLIYL